MRIRDYGIIVGELPTGKLNKITDVDGVTVGHSTIRNERHNTGVTVIMPCRDNMFARKLPCASFVLNGYGKTAGLIQIDELGTLESPIALTNTLNVGMVHHAITEYVIKRCKEENIQVYSFNAVVGECNDAGLNAITDRAVGKEHVFEAIRMAKRDFEEGNVGAGAGTICYGFKGGIGSASRTVELDGKTYTVGILVQSNYGSTADLTLCGKPLGEEITMKIRGEESDKGSIMVILACDVPLTARQLKRVVRRCSVGIARLGSYIGHGSGEVFIGFSTANVIRRGDGDIVSLSCIREEKIDSLFRAVGEATECALVNYANSLGLPKYELEEKQPRKGEAPFDSNRKMMSTIHPAEFGYIQFTKGALDVMLHRCTGYLSEKGEVPITEEIKRDIMYKNKEFASKALRVLCASYRRYDNLPKSDDPEDLEHDLVFIGIVGMIDPCRPEVYDAIKECRSAGIRPVMITGDHKDTAVAIGIDLGIIKDESEAIEGHELDKYSDEEMIELVRKYSVYARVQPEHKTRIVNAWKAQGMVTAMTGDGVNDAPSIKAADIGIGMGITGTDVTKSVADMVLADDNFATIVNAVEEGRKIYDNVCKVIQFQLSTNLCEVIIMFVASLLDFTLLTPVHLLWINMVTDSLPGLALGMEKAEGDVMQRKPRNSSDGIFANGAGVDMVWQGIYLSIIELAAYFIGLYLEKGTLKGFFGGADCMNAIAMAFLTVNFAEIFCAINMRSQTKSIFSKNMMKNFNWWLLGAVIVTMIITLAAIYVPGLSNVFGIEPGTFQLKELLICLGLAMTTFPVFELGKSIRRKALKSE